MSSGISDFFSSFFSPTIYNDAPKEEQPKDEDKKEEKEDSEEPAAEEEEEEEPEDELPAIREECQKSSKCAQLTKHFEHCNEKVHGGEGFKGEDCVEELMMHCVDNCVAPRLFHKLK